MGEWSQLKSLHCAKIQMQSSEHSDTLLLSSHFTWSCVLFETEHFVHSLLKHEDGTKDVLVF